MDNENENQDSLNPEDENQGSENPEEEGSQEEDEMVKLKKTNEQLYARLKKTEAKLEKVAMETKKAEGDDDSEWKEKIEFLIKNKEFDSEELDVVSAFAKGMKKSLEEVSKEPAIIGALKSIREKKANERASTESNTRSESGGEDTLLGKFRAGKLSEEDFRKNFRQIQKEFVQSKRGSKGYE